MDVTPVLFFSEQRRLIRDQVLFDAVYISLEDVRDKFRGECQFVGFVWKRQRFQIGQRQWAAEVVFTIQRTHALNQAAARRGKRVFISVPFLIGQRRRIVADRRYVIVQFVEPEDVGNSLDIRRRTYFQ